MASASVIFLVIASPLFPLVMFLPTDYEVAVFDEHDRILTEVLRTIPPNGSILTQDNIFPHVSHRVHAYVVPDRWIHSGDIRDTAIEFTNQTLDKVDYVLIDSTTDPVASETILFLLQSNPQFVLECSRDNGAILLYHQELD